MVVALLLQEGMSPEEICEVDWDELREDHYRSGLSPEEAVDELDKVS